MHLNALISRDGCPQLDSCPVVTCPGNCNLKTQTCSIVAQSCPSTCATIRCDPIVVQSSGGSGPSPGALAAAVIGALACLGLVMFGYLQYRRREVAKEAARREKANAEVKPDIPARADAVLSRPDPHFGVRAPSSNGSEKTVSQPDPTELGTVRVFNSQSDTTINLDPSQASRRRSGTPSAHSNPFADGVSIQTASDRTQSTNVIPIALVPPGGHPPDPLSHSRAGTPSRPNRTANLILDDTDTNLDHVAVSDPELEPARLPYASSTRSGISGKSFMSTSTTADLDETTTIISPKEGAVRQVVGVSQAQVVRVPSNGGSTNKAGLSNPLSQFSKSRGSYRGLTSKVSIGRSPLAQQSFTSADIPLTNREPASPASTTGSRANPFSDTASPQRTSFADSSRSTDTFGTPTDYSTDGPFSPRPGATFADASKSRPVSTASTVDGVSIRADIGTASRVILGMQSPAAFAPSVLPHPHDNQSRATSMQTNGGRTHVSVDRDDDDESVRPHSLLSAKTTSSRADSVLAGFPFVPPSPISALPPRSPGATSPNGIQSSSGSMFARQQALSKIAPSSPPQSPTSTTTSSHQASQLQVPPVPPIPRLNYASQSTERSASTFTASGLDIYPFQFEGQSPEAAGSQGMGNRASLDTLALSRDLAAFPLDGSS